MATDAIAPFSWLNVHVCFILRLFLNPPASEEKSIRLHYAYGACTQGAQWERNSKQEKHMKIPSLQGTSQVQIHIYHYYLCSHVVYPSRLMSSPHSALMW